MTEDYKTVIVKNICYYTKDTAIKAYFGKVGKIESVEIVHDSKGQSKGIAFVTFENEKSAENAVNSLHGTKLENNTIFVDFENIKIPSNSCIKDIHDDDDDHLIRGNEEEYEKLTIALETEKQNLSLIKVLPVEQNKSRIESIFGKYLQSSLDPKQKIIFDYRNHPIFDGFLDAYRNHRPITISPDIIWLLIVQGFSHHVSKYAEELRPLFVNFDGKKKLKIFRDDFDFIYATSDQWMDSIPDMVNEIAKYTGQKIIDVLTPTFTTTTIISRCVAQMSIMKIMDSYFTYTFCGGCGLPYVTIEGSLEDWQKIVMKLEELRKYKIEWWVDKLIPIINEICETKKGNINKKFWNEMIKIKKGNDYDPGFVNGWFTNFFPFDSEGNEIYGVIYDTTRLNNEMLCLKFDIVSLPLMKKYNAEMLAGFVGMTQNEKTSSLKPEIGWIIRIVKEEPLTESEFAELMS